MLSALLLIFFGYIIYKVFMFKRRVDAVRDDLRRQFEEVGQQFGGATNAQPDHKQHEKRYRQTDGEYVDFEEVRGSFETNSFVKAVLEHIEKKTTLGDKMLTKLSAL